MEPLHNPLTVFVQAIVFIDFMFGNMNMKTTLHFLGGINTFRQGVIRTCQSGM